MRRRTGFFSGGLFKDRATPVLGDGELILRAPRRSDYAAWRDVRQKSRAHLKPYEPSWSESDLEPRVFLARLRTARRRAARGTGFLFFAFLKEGETIELAGGLTLSSIQRGVTQAANLGYWMGINHAGRGLMTRAVALLVPFVFAQLDLHRLNSACLPSNIASRRVLEKNGFREEGFAENFLRINGVRRDHILFALTRERFEGTRIGV